ncbi:type IV pilus biogenesis protein PilM [Ammoniphilus sp. 3BR4]|uniref:type IV pilus biogenesis protein PilM n=1 Tax=Ammoniphilus sp. 3BR4 TaxID=3158265 RepID=UPI0034657E39
MNWKFWRRTANLIGMEIKDSIIKLVELQKNNNEMLLLSYYIDQVPEGLITEGKIQNHEDFSDFLYSVLNKAGIQGKNIHLTISSHNILLRSIRIPNLPKRELKKAVEMEIQNSIQLPFDEYVSDFAVITEQVKGKETKELDLMLVIAPKSYVLSYVEAFQESDLLPQSVDLAPLAVQRVIQKERNIGETYMIVNIGEKSTEVSLFHKQVLRLVRTFNLDLRSYLANMPFYDAQSVLEDRAGENILQSFAADMGNEIERVMNFYLYTLNNRDQSLAEIILVGDIQNLEQVSRYLSTRLNVESHVAKAGGVILSPELVESSFREVEASLVVPLGMALKE